MAELAVFATLLVSVQTFFGLPVATYFLNKEAKSILKNKDCFEVEEEKKEAKAEKKRLIPPLPEELQSTYMLLAKTAIVAVISFKLAGFTGGIVHNYVMCLVGGIVFSELGFLEKNVMTKANSFGLAMTALMAPIFGSLALATPEMLLSLLFPIVVSLCLGTIGIVLFSSVLGKLIKVPLNMAIAIGASALFGFPATYILSNEVARSNGSTPEEKKLILDIILPKMLVAGFVTVTVASVLLAGFMANLV